MEKYSEGKIYKSKPEPRTGNVNAVNLGAIYAKGLFVCKKVLLQITFYA